MKYFRRCTSREGGDSSCLWEAQYTRNGNSVRNKWAVIGGTWKNYSCVARSKTYQRVEISIAWGMEKVVEIDIANRLDEHVEETTVGEV